MNIIEQITESLKAYTGKDFPVEINFSDAYEILLNQQPLSILFKNNCSFEKATKDAFIKSIDINKILAHVAHIILYRYSHRHLEFIFITKEQERVVFNISKKKQGFSFSYRIANLLNTDYKIEPTILEATEFSNEEQIKQTRINLLVNAHGDYFYNQKFIQSIEDISVNYTNKVNESLSHIISCLNSDSPCGKVIILEGQPGTGKSYAIRKILQESVADTFHVLIPVDIVTGLTGPGMLNFISEDEIDNKKRICFIIEDADSVITQTETTNISNILNFGDGILGEALDTRVLLTTNLKKQHINKALIRPGRLCSYIDFQPLEPDHASRVYKNITGESFTFDKAVTLAEVYRQARADKFYAAKSTDMVGQYL